MVTVVDGAPVVTNLWVVYGDGGRRSTSRH